MMQVMILKMIKKNKIAEQGEGQEDDASDDNEDD